MLQWLQRKFSRKKESARTTRQKTGDWGEQLAQDTLVAQGYQLFARNWQSGKDEIDLIMMDGQTMVFVEVRVRSEYARTNAYFSVNYQKKKSLRRVCKAYLYALQHKPAHIRFDIFAITMKTNHPPITHHYQNIPLFGKHFHFN